ncbi:MAG: DUF3253 domain-containing protein [Pseudomonadota bacterium]
MSETARQAAAQDAILALLAARRQGATICPSEAARALDPEGWRALMPLVRRAAGAMAAAGRIAVLQRGRPVEIETARGPIRLGLPADAKAGPGGE